MSKFTVEIVAFLLIQNAAFFTFCSSFMANGSLPRFYRILRLAYLLSAAGVALYGAVTPYFLLLGVPLFGVLLFQVYTYDRLLRSLPCTK